MPKECNTPRCKTCERKLKVGTSVPRWNEENLQSHSRAFLEWLKAKREDEIANGRYGYLGESEFCSAECAAFLARAVLNSTRLLAFQSDLDELEFQLKRFPWVIERRAKYAPKGKADA